MGNRQGTAGLRRAGRRRSVGTGPTARRARADKPQAGRVRAGQVQGGKVQSAGPGAGKPNAHRPHAAGPDAAKPRASRPHTDKPRSNRARPDRHRSPVPAGLDLVYGLHAGEAALANPARTIRAVWASRDIAQRLADRQPRAIEIADADALAARVPPGAVHQGLVVLAEPLAEPDISDVAAMTRVAVLDQVTDPHNLGAILRSAAAFGIEAVVTTERHAPTVTGLVAKTASGALERVPLIRATNLARAIETLRGHGFFCVGLAGESEVELADAIADAPRLALVLGAEGPGLRRLTRERCDMLARIAMPGGMASLNVSNAAAIAFYLVSRGGPQLASRAAAD